MNTFFYLQLPPLLPISSFVSKLITELCCSFSCSFHLRRNFFIDIKKEEVFLRISQIELTFLHRILFRSALFSAMPSIISSPVNFSDHFIFYILLQKSSNRSRSDYHLLVLKILSLLGERNKQLSSTPHSHPLVAPNIRIRNIFSISWNNRIQFQLLAYLNHAELIDILFV